MTEESKKIKQTKSSLVGKQAVPTTLDSTAKLDIDTSKSLVDGIIDAGLTGGLNVGELEKFTSISNSRDQLYTLIDTMAKDSSVGAIIKTYADSACEVGDNGHIVWCESSDPKISKFVNYLLNVMNVDKNIYGWTYCLVKYGDVYLRLFRESDYEDPLFNKANIEQAYNARNVLNESARQAVQESVNLNIHKVNDPYSYYLEMIRDPGTMYELTKYGKTFGYIETPNQQVGLDISNNYMGGTELNYANYRMKSNDVNIYQADDFVHAYLDDNYDRYPEQVSLFTSDIDYTNNTNAHAFNVRRGKSMLIDNYKVWREKSLLENAIILNRVTKSSIVRLIGVDGGDMSREQISQTLRRVKDLFEQKSSINSGNSFSEYPNPGPIENNVYYVKHNGQGQITVEAVGGDPDVKGLADLESWVNKFYAGFGVPKAYYGWTEDGAGFNGGSSLSIISSVFSKGVIHVQNAMIQALTDAINLFLLNRGLKSYLNNFVLKMKTPVTQEDVSYRENLTNRINAISSLNSLFTGVEDKARQLTLLKDSIGSLNLGDSFVATLDEEIKAVKEKARQEAEQAKKDAAEQAKLEAAEASTSTKPESSESEVTEPTATESEEKDTEELDLGMSSVAPLEGFKPETGTSSLVEGPDFDVILDEDSLPTPEEANESIDFTKNN